MDIDPKSIVFFWPSNLRPFKDNLFNRVGSFIQKRGGRVIRGDVPAMEGIAEDQIPIYGCMPELSSIIRIWTKAKRDRVYWDRGYSRRVFATWLPRGENGGYYRWTRNGFQMRVIRDVPSDRWESLNTPLLPWKKNGKHIVIAAPTPTFEKFHGIETWMTDTIRRLSTITDRQLVIRDKATKRPLQWDLDGAHCLVSHASMAAVEAAILGCPVFVDPSSAAALIGMTNIEQIERPIYPDRAPWAWSLGYSQYNEAELVDGTLFRLLE